VNVSRAWIYGGAVYVAVIAMFPVLADTENTTLYWTLLLASLPCGYFAVMLSYLSLALPLPMAIDDPFWLVLWVPLWGAAAICNVAFAWAIWTEIMSPCLHRLRVACNRLVAHRP
jgi:hypothetical protein